MSRSATRSLNASATRGWPVSPRALCRALRQVLMRPSAMPSATTSLRTPSWANKREHHLRRPRRTDQPHRLRMTSRRRRGHERMHRGTLLVQLQVPARGWFWSETAPMSGHPIAFLAFLGFRITGHGCTLSTHLCYEIFIFIYSQSRRPVSYSIPNSHVRKARESAGHERGLFAFPLSVADADIRHESRRPRCAGCGGARAAAASDTNEAVLYSSVAVSRAEPPQFK